MGATASVPKDIPLGCILINWSTYGYEPMTKKMIFIVVLFGQCIYLTQDSAGHSMVLLLCYFVVKTVLSEIREMGQESLCLSIYGFS